MTTYKGESLNPIYANGHNSDLIQEAEDLMVTMKQCSERLNQIMTELPQDTPIVSNVVKDDTEQCRTYIVGKPTGHYVSYRELEFVMNAKTTKADSKYLEETV